MLPGRIVGRRCCLYMEPGLYGSTMLVCPSNCSDTLLVAQLGCMGHYLLTVPTLDSITLSSACTVRGAGSGHFKRRKHQFAPRPRCALGCTCVHSRLLPFKASSCKSPPPYITASRGLLAAEHPGADLYELRWITVLRELNSPCVETREEK